MTFPKGFLWGVATSSHQIEGNDVLSDWWKYEEMGRIGKNVKSGAACDSWNKWRLDNEWVEKLGLNAYRFSVSWARIEPKEGQWNGQAVEHYRSIIRDLNKRKVKVVVCLHHFVNPRWFTDQGGWERPGNVDYFVRFAKRLTGEIGKGVDYWITFNEPMVLLTGYALGVWPPFKRNPRLAKRVVGNLATAHARAYKAVHEVRKDARVGVVMAMTKYEAAGWGTGWLAGYLDKTINHWFLDRVRDELDWVGVNYYARLRLKWDTKWLWAVLWGKKSENLKMPGEGGWRSPVMGLEVYPEGLRWAIEAVEDIGKPILVSENGYEDGDDKKRIKFIKAHLQVLDQCLREGKDVRGYFYWSLLDNFEWTFGYGPKFGLLTRDRKPKESALVFKSAIRDRKDK